MVKVEYIRKRSKAREEAQLWQNDFAKHSYSYAELMEFANYFERLAKRYGLVKEFRENGII